MVRIGAFAACSACSLALALCLAGCSGGADPSASSPSDGPSSSTQVSSDLETHGSLGMFEATTLEGDSFTQVDLAKTDVTIFDFWSTGCGPCVSEMPQIAALESGLPDNVRVVGVCLDGQYNADRARQILQDAGFEGTTLIGGNNGFSDLCDSIQYTPTKVLVCGDGTVVGDYIVGGRDDMEDVLLAAVNEVLAWMGEEGVRLETAR